MKCENCGNRTSSSPVEIIGEGVKQLCRDCSKLAAAAQLSRRSPAGQEPKPRTVSDEEKTRKAIVRFCKEILWRLEALEATVAAMEANEPLRDGIYLEQFREAAR